MINSSFILGTAKFASLTGNELSGIRTRLFEDSRIDFIRIDTARSYGESEEIVSKYFAHAPKNVLVDTKIAMNEKQRVTRKVLQDQFFQSYKALSPLEINCLYLHSTKLSLVSEDALEFLNDLRTSGHIRFLGYSGDGEQLRIATTMNLFDSFMCTFSVIDQGNRETVGRIDARSNLSLKRVLGSGVLKQRRFKSLRRKMGLLLGEDWASATHTYQYRYEAMSRKLGFTPSLNDFLSYAHFIFPSAKQVIAVSTSKHLTQVLDFNPGSYKDGSRGFHIETAWKQLSGDKWGTIT